MAAVASAIAEIAAGLVAARRRGRGLAAFPGRLPTTLAEAYAIQRAALDLWGDRIAGWKVGRLTPALADRFGVDRFIGPVFAAATHWAGKGEAVFSVFAGGSAAFEAEYVAILGPDAANGEAAELRIGVEVAGSPIAAMPTLDSLASIADLGNNNGQIVGAAVPVALLDTPERLTCATMIDGVPVRAATAADLPGGPLTALRFAAEQARRLGLPLRPGQFVSTGAVTGMHWIDAGQRCSAAFGEWGAIDVISRAGPASTAL